MPASSKHSHMRSAKVEQKEKYDRFGCRMRWSKIARRNHEVPLRFTYNYIDKLISHLILKKKIFFWWAEKEGKKNEYGACKMRRCCLCFLCSASQCSCLTEKKPNFFPSYNEKQLCSGNERRQKVLHNRLLFRTKAAARNEKFSFLFLRLWDAFCDVLVDAISSWWWLFYIFFLVEIIKITYSHISWDFFSLSLSAVV